MDPVEAKKRFQAVREAEQRGEVADSMDVRQVLVERMDRGEITLEEAQEELRRIKRGAKATGMTTRGRAFRGR
jgi:uncharacterized membrane protein YjjP (DUF1212 family)